MKSNRSRIAAWLSALILTGLLLAPEAAAAEKPARPNILFAIADDWGYGHASAYGCRWVKTPGFDRVAQAGILFTHAYTPNAKCAPSRACILTGRNSWQLKEACNHIPYFPPEFKTFAEALSERGYFVGMTSKGWAPGAATNAAGRPRQMTGQPFNKRTAPPPAGGIGRNDYAGNFADFLAAAPKDKPWCFWYGAVEPHRGYEYGSGVAKGGKRLADVDRVPGYWPDNDVVRNDMLDYDLATDPECLTNLVADARFRGAREKLQQQLFDELKAQGDPRMFGEGQVFEQYPYANPGQRNFYERFMRGEKTEAGWVNKSDFEKTPLD